MARKSKHSPVITALRLSQDFPALKVRTGGWECRCHSTTQRKKQFYERRKSIVQNWGRQERRKKENWN